MTVLKFVTQERCYVVVCGGFGTCFTSNVFWVMSRINLKKRCNDGEKTDATSSFCLTKVQKHVKTDLIRITSSS